MIIIKKLRFLGSIKRSKIDFVYFNEQNLINIERRVPNIPYYCAFWCNQDNTIGRFIGHSEKYLRLKNWILDSHQLNWQWTTSDDKNELNYSIKQVIKDNYDYIIFCRKAGYVIND